MGVCERRRTPVNRRTCLCTVEEIRGSIPLGSTQENKAFAGETRLGNTKCSLSTSSVAFRIWAGAQSRASFRRRGEAGFPTGSEPLSAS
jgi:hypothetical protein